MPFSHPRTLDARVTLNPMLANMGEMLANAKCFPCEKHPRPMHLPVDMGMTRLATPKRTQYWTSPNAPKYSSQSPGYRAAFIGLVRTCRLDDVPRNQRGQCIEIPRQRCSPVPDPGSPTPRLHESPGKNGQKNVATDPWPRIRAPRARSHRNDGISGLGSPQGLERRRAAIGPATPSP